MMGHRGTVYSFTQNHTASIRLMFFLFTIIIKIIIISFRRSLPVCYEGGGGVFFLGYLDQNRENCFSLSLFIHHNTEPLER